jgi:hypothetical protein
MNGIEQLKRRTAALTATLAPAQVNDYPKSAWEMMSPDEKRADCRKWIKVWTNHHPEDIQSEEETEAMITRLIGQVDNTSGGPTDQEIAHMPDPEIERRAGEILHRARETTTGRGRNDHD